MSDHVAQLVEQAKAGNRAAACELITEFYQRIFGYFRRLCGSEEDAEDLTQKTFCKVWDSLARYNGRSTFNTWLHAIAHHVYVDWRRIRNPIDAQSDAWWNLCVADGPSPHESAAQRDAAIQAYRAVDELADEERELIHLHYYQSLSIQETAEALGVATSTVKYRLRKALAALATRLAEPKAKFAA